MLVQQMLLPPTHRGAIHYMFSCRTLCAPARTVHCRLASRMTPTARRAVG